MGEVWVVSRDYGYEGLQEPVAAFLSEPEAEAYAKHVGSDLATYRVNKTALMRLVPATIEPAELPPPMSRDAEER